jgi:hypothetical protein
MARGNNDIANGITKVQRFFTIRKHLTHPVSGVSPAPSLFHSNELTWFQDEITGYFWKSTPNGEYIDRPVDSNDHAMDAMKYMLSKQPEIGRFRTPGIVLPSWASWQETEHATHSRKHRYGN